MAEKNTFLGRGWAFPVTFLPEASQVNLVENEEDIRQSLIILLNTTIGERVLRPDYGANMEDLLFEALNVTTATMITNRIKRAILFHEPRVKVEEIDMRPDFQEGRVEVLISYFIISTNNRQNLVYPYLFIEATDVSK
ncbi:GPW/gp25 family protein [Algoriphagus sp. H41]|uniref:GPW/gp25 family protein n=1 Tax=Algoriphagus oliviformis TaxID=2811231 RepID=A0ABS3C170_9BACT|nr:GPW/gp25 family protein [Algoriphagus oliviformis]MBN7809920.1 GPW/gp25 family protein [Algoriphagus oliviformis]